MRDPARFEIFGYGGATIMVHKRLVATATTDANWMDSQTESAMALLSDATLDRAGGKFGNKGDEAAVSALKMLSIA